VGGTLTGVHFAEGAVVEANALLLTIDPRQYEAAVKQAQANQERDNAQLTLAQEQFRSIDALFKQGLATQDQHNQARAAVDALKAAVKADGAVLENAKLQLEYCSIRSPFTGRAGKLLIDGGSLVKANDLPVVVLHQVQPIYVTLTVPEQELAGIREQMAARKLAVKAWPPDGPERVEEGELTFIDPQVDSPTGTVRLKATFANRDERLWPGQFVNVVLTLTVQNDAIVVPSEAIQVGQRGQFVFVVKDDQTVEQRPIAAGRAVDGMTVVDRGLAPGERVVTDGQFRLTPGAKADVKGGPATRPASAPASAPVPARRESRP
jgi:multidrug efflux system membrane fusion protein